MGDRELRCGWGVVWGPGLGLELRSKGSGAVRSLSRMWLGNLKAARTKTRALVRWVGVRVQGWRVFCLGYGVEGSG